MSDRRLVPALATVVALLLVFPLLVSNTVLRMGSLLDSFLPWLALTVPLLLLLRRSVLVLLPVLAWFATFGILLLPASSGANFVVVQHNVSDVNSDPTGTARALVGAKPDLIGLEEVTTPAYGEALRALYPYSTVQGTVGLWSRYPLVEAAHLDIKPAGLNADWNRALRAVARTPHGDVAVYVAHLPSFRPGLTGLNTARRDDSAKKLGRAIAAERLPRVILIGDLNSTVDDRGLEPLTSQLSAPRRGFAFSFPATLPIARIDQVMARGAKVNSVRTLPKTGSDHLPIAANLRL